VLLGLAASPEEVAALPMGAFLARRPVL